MRRAVIIAILGLMFASGIIVLTQQKQLKIFLSTLGTKWTRLHPDVQARALGVLNEANNDPVFSGSGLGVGIFSGWRDISAQEKEIKEGDSTLSNALNSYHVWGLAVDFVFLTDSGSWSWLDDETNELYGGDARKNPHWQRLGQIIKKWGFEWGGDFRSIFDGPHAQRRIRTPTQLRAQFNDLPNEFFDSSFFAGVA